MTNTNTLSAAKRDGTGKGVARQLRLSGRVPAVLYGKDMESVSLSVDAHDAMHLFTSISVDNTIIDLAVEGEKAPVPTLVREIQTHAYRRELLHIDFLRVQKGVVVDVDIPIHLEGVAVGVKMAGGTMEQIIHELPVRCIPSNIPESLGVDVSHLDLGDSLHVADIALPEGVEVTIDLERTICSVAAPRVEAEPAEEEEGLEPEEGVEVEEEVAEGGQEEAGTE